MRCCVQHCVLCHLQLGGIGAVVLGTWFFYRMQSIINALQTTQLFIPLSNARMPPKPINGHTVCTMSAHPVRRLLVAGGSAMQRRTYASGSSWLAVIAGRLQREMEVSRADRVCQRCSSAAIDDADHMGFDSSRLLPLESSKL